MSAVSIASAGRVQSWLRKVIKQKLPSSTWDQLSNRYEWDQPIAKSGDNKVPSTVVHKVGDSLRQGQYSVTMLSIRKTGAAVIGGANSALGKSTKPTTKIFTAYFTNQRVPKSLPDMSVMGQQSEYYGIAEATIGMIADDFVEQTDYDHQRAMIAGCDYFLQDTGAWQDSEYGSDFNAPLSDVLHPNIYWFSNDAATKNTWNATYATAVTNLATAVDTEMDTNDIFNLAVLDKIALIANRNIISMGGMSGGKAGAEVKWVLKISDAQHFQLTTDTTAGQMKDTFKYTESGFDRIFNGYMGVYKNMMIIVDQRAPLFNISGSTAGAFQYITPLSDGRTRVTKGSNTGTLEVAMLMGPGAIGLADVKEMELDREELDFKFIKAICGQRMRGTQRVDLDATVAATSARVNETSAIFLTATTATVIST